MIVMPPPAETKHARARLRTRFAGEVGRAIDRLRALAASRFPVEAAALPVGPLTLTRITWTKPILDLYTYTLSAWAFDLEQAHPGVVEAARAELTPERLERLGVAMLRAAAEHPDFEAKRTRIGEDSPAHALSAVATTLERILLLAIASGSNADALVASVS